MIKRISGTIKEYAWGGHEFLPKLLGLEFPSEQPQAEYWLGSHPLGMTRLEENDNTLKAYLGKAKLGELPFMLKILDVRDMLSIQVHPNKEQAEKGYDRENTEGIPIKAFHRTYKDRNHKPELMVSLSEFWMVHGFKNAEKLSKTLEQTPELFDLHLILMSQGVEALYQHIMTSEQVVINQLLKPLGKRIKPQYEKGALQKTSIDFWAARAFLTHNRKGVCDRGILSLYLMNLLKLEPGQAVFQAPGVLHAYLEGQNIECMANSDNVIRGGLTNKYIDHGELLNVVDYQGKTILVNPMKKDTDLMSFPVNAPEFELGFFTGKDLELEVGPHPMIAFCLAGSYGIRNQEGEISMETGEAVIITNRIRMTSLTDSPGRLVLAQKSSPHL